MQFYENEAQFVRELMDQVEKEYPGVGHLDHFRRMTDGERNDAFFVSGQSGRYVIRVIHHSTAVEGVIYTNRWTRIAAEKCDVVIAPYLTKSGESFFRYNGRIVGLYPFAEGSHADINDEQIRDDMALRQAQLHRIGLDCDIKTQRPDRPQMLQLNLEDNFLYNWENVDKMLRSGGAPMFNDPRRQSPEDLRCAHELYDRREALYRAKEEFTKLIHDINAKGMKLTYAPVHGDIYSPNVLTKNHKITGIIDWDECGYEVIAYELARTCFMFCTDETKTTFDMARAERFLKVYEENGGPAPKSEYFLMIPLLRMLKFMDIMLYLNNTIIGDTWTPSFGLESIIALDRLAEVHFE